MKENERITIKCTYEEFTILRNSLHLKIEELRNEKIELRYSRDVMDDIEYFREYRTIDKEIEKVKDLIFAMDYWQAFYNREGVK